MAKIGDSFAVKADDAAQPKHAANKYVVAFDVFDASGIVAKS
jgi:hypothetical protein